MNFGSSKVKRLIAVFALLIATSMPLMASENVISSVMITKAKNGLGGYELNIDSTQQVPYRSHIDSDGNVYFDLKNSTLSAGLGTIYDDVSNIDNVSVKQLDKNKVRIYVNGRDARDTELVFLNSFFETSKDSAKKVTINRPINEYKSTRYLNEDLEAQDEIQDWDDNSFNFSHLATTILSELKDGSWGKIILALALLALMSAFAKSLTSKLAQDREPLIGLNSSKTLDRKNIGTVSRNIQASIQEELPSVERRRDALIQAQAELSKAHQKYQQYLQNKYQGNYQPKSVDVDAIRKGIALNQYQKSTQNPYKNQEVIKMSNGFSKTVEQKGNYQIPPRPRTQQRSEFTSPYIQRVNNFVKPEIKNDEAKQNMRFLDSVTKIYERSGRGDLANGLKNSISKAKQNI